MINRPWGASNDGESVNVFMQRGMEAVGFGGDGAVVVADDPTLDWPARVLANLQRAALEAGFYVQRMMPQLVETSSCRDNRCAVGGTWCANESSTGVGGWFGVGRLRFSARNCTA